MRKIVTTRRFDKRLVTFVKAHPDLFFYFLDIGSHDDVYS